MSQVMVAVVTNKNGFLLFCINITPADSMSGIKNAHVDVAFAMIAVVAHTQRHIYSGFIQGRLIC